MKLALMGGSLRAKWRQFVDMPRELHPPDHGTTKREATWTEKDTKPYARGWHPLPIRPRLRKEPKLSAAYDYALGREERDKVIAERETSEEVVTYDE